jgi:hypothetical protein
MFNVDANHCAGVFDSWMRDIDFSPNGSYFVVSTTGAFAGRGQRHDVRHDIALGDQRGRRRTPTDLA